MEKSQDSIKKFYNNHSNELRVSQRVVKIITETPQWIVGKTILDVGCGNGLISTFMKVYGKVTGIDINEDITSDTDFGKHDVVTCFDVLEHIHPGKLQKAVDNIKRSATDLIIINQPEQFDLSQPLDNTITLMNIQQLFDLKLIYLEWYQVGHNESYNYMVLKI